MPANQNRTALGMVLMQQWAVFLSIMSLGNIISRVWQIFTVCASCIFSWTVLERMNACLLWMV